HLGLHNVNVGPGATAPQRGPSSARRNIKDNMATTGTTNPRQRQGLFLQGFLRQWRTVGAIIPSGRQLGITLAAMTDPARTLHAAELGPGTGALTRPLLDRLRPDAHLMAVEIYAPFAEHLRTEVTDPRLEVVTADARKLPELLAERGWPGADLVLSSIPLTPI